MRSHNLPSRKRQFSEIKVFGDPTTFFKKGLVTKGAFFQKKGAFSLDKKRDFLLYLMESVKKEAFHASPFYFLL